MQFKDIPGHNKIKTLLARSASEARVPHAQLFWEKEGYGGLALALAFAQYVFCEHPTASDSCGECLSCKQVAQLKHPDLHFSYPVIRSNGLKEAPISTDYIKIWREVILANPYTSILDWLQTLDIGNKQGNITVRECQEIIRKLKLKSFEASFRMLIMWRPEYLGAAGNVLLKLIEEPPPNTLIILVTDNPDQILGTIMSRTQLIKINPVSDDDISDYLKRQYLLDEQSAVQIARLADGDVHAAIKMVHEESGEMESIFRSWMNICYQFKAKEMVRWVDEVAAMGREKQKNLLLYSIHYLRESLAIPYIGAEKLKLQASESKGAVFLSEKLAFEQFELLSGLFEKSHYHIERNANPKILFLNLSMDITHVMHKTRNN